MRNIEINVEDTVAIEVTLPRDLTNTSVKLFIGRHRSKSANVTIINAEEGIVQVELSELNLTIGPTKIFWKIKYAEGGTEIVPPEGDSLYVHP